MTNSEQPPYGWQRDGYEEYELWTCEGGDGVPPYPPESVGDDPDGRPDPTVFLFTCVECGRRWANPHVPIAGCRCGGDVVAHTFHYEKYDQLMRQHRIEP